MFKALKPPDVNDLNGLNRLNGLNCLFFSLAKQILHLTSGLLDTDDNRSSNDTVTDIELDHLRDLRDG
jgi:hypothetical protein